MTLSTTIFNGHGFNSSTPALRIIVVITAAIRTRWVATYPNRRLSNEQLLDLAEAGFDRMRRGDILPCGCSHGVAARRIAAQRRQVRPELVEIVGQQTGASVL